MKVAYFAVDRTAHKAHGVLEKHFSTVDFFLADADSKTINVDISEIPVVACNVCVPADRSLRSVQQNLVMQELRHEYSSLLNNIYPKKNLQNEILDSIPITSGNIKKISDIHYIQFNREKNKFIVEYIGNGTIEYDFILIQDNQFMMSLLLDKQRDLFYHFSEQSKLILNMDFELKHCHAGVVLPQDFIFVENIYVKTISDNWYICQMRQDRLAVYSYIPLEMQASADYIDFLAKRFTQMLNANFEAFKVGSLLEKNTLPCDGFFTRRAKLRYAKQTALVPTFTFWSQSKINFFLSQLVGNKVSRVVAKTNVEKELI